MASSIDEVKEIRDKAEAMRQYARQTRESLVMQNRCAEIKLRAERRIGEMLREGEVSRRGQNNLLRGRTTQPREPEPTLADLGISKSQSSRYQMISRIDSQQFERRVREIQESGKELTSKEMLGYAKYLERERAREVTRQKAKEEAASVKPDERMTILHGDFREVLAEPILEPESVDLVLTDPPYAKEYLHLWADLSKFAAQVLKPGRLLVTYSGQYHLAEVMRLLSLHLQYVWTAAVVHKNRPDTVFPLRIMTCWKPVLVFSRGRYSPIERLEWFKDRIDGDGRCKSHHDWQQGVGEAGHIIEALTLEGNLVVDPFLGSGAAAVACKRLKRRFLGCDVDADAVNVARGRLAE